MCYISGSQLFDGGPLAGCASNGTGALNYFHFTHSGARALLHNHKPPTNCLQGAGKVLTPVPNYPLGAWGGRPGAGARRISEGPG
ncbi:hypothetical protein TNCV_1895721 [Trichonephila clavipes]|nr:hypothetical protein TNCV_1895721 [Trichonephila clavipes]